MSHCSFAIPVEEFPLKDFELREVWSFFIAEHYK
jgi:hypothetical protein